MLISQLKSDSIQYVKNGISEPTQLHKHELATNDAYGLAKASFSNYQAYLLISDKIAFGFCQPHQKRRDEISDQLIQRILENRQKNLDKQRLELLDLKSQTLKEIGAFLLDYSNRMRDEAEYDPAVIFQDKQSIQDSVKQSPVLNDPVTGLIILNDIKDFKPVAAELTMEEMETQFRNVQNSAKETLIIAVKNALFGSTNPDLSQADRELIDELIRIAESTDGVNFGKEFTDKLSTLIKRQHNLEMIKLQAEIKYKRKFVWGESLTPQKREQVKSKMDSSPNDIYKVMLESNREVIFTDVLSNSEIHERKHTLEHVKNPNHTHQHSDESLVDGKVRVSVHKHNHEE